MKVCKDCKELLPLEYFYNNRSYADGKQSNCKKCHSVKQKECYNKNIEKRRASSREYRQKHREERAKQDKIYKLNNLDRCREVVREWHKNNKEYLYLKRKEYYEKNKKEMVRKKVESGRNKVYCMVRYYLKKGTLVKPEICPYCGQKKVIHGHHEDYSKPLEVDWSCSLCHKSKYHSKLTGVSNEQPCK
jgi:hypothetical protein